MRKLIILVLVTALIFAAAYYLLSDNLSVKPLSESVVIDSLVVYKSERKMYAFTRNRLVRSYDISLGGNPVGDKQHEGDERTPEGLYRINDRNPNSRYHKNLGISYPNSADSMEAAAIGKPAGGDIKIHGLMNGLGQIGRAHLRKDWTNGCIAVTDEEIDELYTHVRMEARINILP